MLTTHYLDEADSLADRVIVIDHGAVIADDTPQRLKDDLAGDHMALTVADAGDVTARGRRDRAHRASPGSSTVDERTVARPGATGGSILLPGLLRDLDGGGVAVAAAEVARPTLDDVFLTLTGRSLREGAQGGRRAGRRDAESTTPVDHHPHRHRPAHRAPPPPPPTTSRRSRHDAPIFADTALVMGRELRPLLRNPFSLVFTLVQPLVFLALFGPLLPQVSGFEDGSSLQWFVPGIIVMSTLFGVLDDRLEPAARDADRRPRAHARRAAEPPVAAGRPGVQGDRPGRRPGR